MGPLILSPGFRNQTPHQHPQSLDRRGGGTRPRSAQIEQKISSSSRISAGRMHELSRAVYMQPSRSKLPDAKGRRKDGVPANASPIRKFDDLLLPVCRSRFLLRSPTALNGVSDTLPAFRGEVPLLFLGSLWDGGSSYRGYLSWPACFPSDDSGCRGAAT